MRYCDRVSAKMIRFGDLFTLCRLVRIRKSFGFRLPVVLAISAMFSVGCATTSTDSTAKPTTRTKLIRTQAGDQVTLQWDSDPGVEYSVIYSRTLGKAQKWQRLPNYSDIPGNGTTTIVRFTAPESGRLYYRLSKQRRP